VENYLAIVSTLRNVVGDARKGDARAAGHTREKWEAWAKVLRKMRLSPLPPPFHTAAGRAALRPVVQCFSAYAANRAQSAHLAAEQPRQFRVECE